MEYEGRKLTGNLIKTSNKSANRDFSLFNGFGNLFHDRYLLGEEENKKYCIMNSFIAVCYIPWL